MHDPAGGGDAVVAVVAAGLAIGCRSAVGAAGGAGLGIVSRKAGIALVRAEELLEGLTEGRSAARKLVSLPLAAEVMERWRHRGWRVGLPPGHLPCPEALTGAGAPLVRPPAGRRGPARRTARRCWPSGRRWTSSPCAPRAGRCCASCARTCWSR
jgi:hypothetical protein